MSFLVACAFVACIAQNSSERVEVQVDRRIELMTLLARLAGFQEFSQRNSASPYSQEVDERFADLAAHPAVETLRRLRQERGVGFDAIPAFAVHLNEDWEARIPYAERPERLDERWSTEEAEAFLGLLLDFVIESGVEDFFDEQAAYYERVEARLRDGLKDDRSLDWFDEFFGAKPTARYVAIPGLLCGGGNFGVGVRFPDERPEEILPVFGCSQFDDEGLPVFSGFQELFAHELCHSYTNQVVDQFAEQLRPAAEQIYPRVAERMRRQAYGNWRTMMYESVVRACVVRCLAATQGPEAAEQREEVEIANGFLWISELSALLGQYEAERDRWPTFVEFFPQVVTLFEGVAAE